MPGLVTSRSAQTSRCGVWSTLPSDSLSGIINIYQHCSPALKYDNEISTAVPAAEGEASTQLYLHFPQRQRF